LAEEERACGFAGLDGIRWPQENVTLTPGREKSFCWRPSSPAPVILGDRAMNGEIEMQSKNDERPACQSYGECTHGHIIKKVFDIGKAAIYAGSVYDAKTRGDAHERKTAIIQLCASTSSAHACVEMSDGAERDFAATHKASKSTAIHRISVDWSDSAAPPVSTEWWMALVKDISRFDGDVIFCCVGGHGRTGTALVAVAHFANVVKGDVVMWIRENYCKSAVESLIQLDWLKSVGVQTIAEAKPPYAYTYDTWNGSGNETYAHRDDYCDDCRYKKVTVDVPSGLGYCDECYEITDSSKSSYKTGTGTEKCADCEGLSASRIDQPNQWLCNECLFKRMAHVVKGEERGGVINDV